MEAAILPRELNLKRQVVVQIWKCDPVFAANRLSDNDLVDVVKLVPIFVSAKQHEQISTDHNLELIHTGREWEELAVNYKVFSYLATRALVVYNKRPFPPEGILRFNILIKFPKSLNSKSLDQFDSCTHWSSLSLTRGSNLGPPGIAMLSALAVKKDFRSNR